VQNLLTISLEFGDFYVPISLTSLNYQKKRLLSPYRRRVFEALERIEGTPGKPSQWLRKKQQWDRYAVNGEP
jgi:hypothetical protein